MDPLFERFTRLIRSMSLQGDLGFQESYDDYDSSADQDYREAFQEVEDFLRDSYGDDAFRDNIFREGTGSSSGRSSARTSADRSAEVRIPPDELREDYQRLEVPFGADFNDVRRSYKKLIRKHHPDVNETNSESRHTSTETAKQLNLSFNRIRAWETIKRENYKT